MYNETQSTGTKCHGEAIFKTPTVQSAIQINFIIREGNKACVEATQVFRACVTPATFPQIVTGFNSQVARSRPPTWPYSLHN